MVLDRGSNASECQFLAMKHEARKSNSFEARTTPELVNVSRKISEIIFVTIFVTVFVTDLYFFVTDLFWRLARLDLCECLRQVGPTYFCDGFS